MLVMTQPRLSGKEKLFKEPWIPLAGLATVGALVLGVHSFYKGESQKSNRMMRLRIFFQGTAILGIVISAANAKWKE